MTLSCRQYVNLADDEIGCKGIIAIISIGTHTLHEQRLVGAPFFALGSRPSARAH